MAQPQDALGYQSGFGNEFATEAHPGALPQGQTRLSMLRSASTRNKSAALPSPLRAP